MMRRCKTTWINPSDYSGNLQRDMSGIKILERKRAREELPAKYNEGYRADCKLIASLAWKDLPSDV